MLLVITATLAATFAQAAPEPREHELRVGGPVTLAAGAHGSASVSIVPAAGRRIDAEAPLSIRLVAAPAAGLVLPRHRYTLGDAADPRAEAPRFDLALEGQAAGSYTLRIEARFWLCAARSCRAVRDTVEIPVTVEAAPGAAAPPTTTSR